MTDAPAYSIRSLIHSYDGKTVLDIPRFDIPSGQICTFTGPNGCGKSTLLSILALLLTPVSGSVLLHGVETVRSRDTRLRREVTLVHQRPVLFSTTVWNNVAYGLKALGFPAKSIRSRLQAIMEETGLSHVAEKQARKLSGGETQRVVLARALVMETPIVLLDEPTSSLDDTSRPVLWELLRQSNQKRGTTIVIATHDLNFLSSLPARVVPLEKGKILESLKL
jgi:tungstate transport system ATP-binding protein